MVDQNLLTVFIALTTLAVLIQTGILVGFFFLSTKLSRQADQAIDVTRNILGPLQNAVENLEAVSARAAEYGQTVRGQLRQLETRWRRSA
ncbi:MAG TPA: hypothetical protein VKY31_14730 [Terriglobia bacterium]|nr:hypothetical protein [Terriglobia bacterium]